MNNTKQKTFPKKLQKKNFKLRMEFLHIQDDKVDISEKFLKKDYTYSLGRNLLMKNYCC